MPRTQRTHPTDSAARRLGPRAAAAAALAAALVAATPLAASAHVGVSPETVAAGTSSDLTFAFSHGCDGSPTTALEFEIPDGVTNVTPNVEAGWTIEVTRAANESVSTVVYTADAPIEDGLRATVTLTARMGEDLADSTVAFPVTQRCENGETAWTQIPEEGQDHDDLESPAPLVTVGAVASDDHHGAGAGAGSDHGDATDHGDANASASETSEGQILPLVLGGAGLVAGAAALVVAIVALRRRA